MPKLDDGGYIELKLSLRERIDMWVMTHNLPILIKLLYLKFIAKQHTSCIINSQPQYRHVIYKIKEEDVEPND